MSLWTDRELKTLIARVNELEKRLGELEKLVSEELEKLVSGASVSLDSNGHVVDKRTKEYRQWKNANS